MKKTFNFILFALATVLSFTACHQDELVFDYEKLHFETKANAILLEVIVPSSTSPSDEIYVVGAFNDNKISEDFKLMKHDQTNIKFGIYIYPEDFVAGKSLADGFTFFNKKQGYEKAEEMHVIENAQLGSLYIISFSRWAGLPEEDPGAWEPGEYEHLYVTGNIEGSSWDPANPIEMEMVGTDIFRANLTFTSETSYFAFSTAKGEWSDFNAARWGGASNDLLVEGDKVQLVNEGEPCVTIAQGTYTITVNMVEKQVVIGEGDWGSGSTTKFPTIAHDGQDIVFAANYTSWTEMTLYMWGDVNNLDREGGDTAGWPGLVPDGEFDFNGVHWYYWLIGAANDGKSENMIFNNNGGGEQTNDYHVTFANGNEIFVKVVGDKADCELIEDPTTIGSDTEEGVDPTPDPEEPIVPSTPDSAVINLYLLDHTTEAFATSVQMLNVYAWGSSECFGVWPGVNIREWPKTIFLGESFFTYTINCVEDEFFNLIITNKGNTDGELQYDALQVQANGHKTSYFIELLDNKAIELVPTSAGMRRR